MGGGHWTEKSNINIDVFLLSLFWKIKISHHLSILLNLCTSIIIKYDERNQFMLVLISNHRQV